jgi:serine/threonine protein kinase
MTARPDPRVGTELGPYRIESVIGRGGMGVVYLATHAGLDRRVALKLLTPDYADDEGFRARFLRESKLAASIDHPNIIPVYDAGEIEGTFYLAMRYVDGTDLETRLRAGPLTPRETVHLLSQVGSALDAAHEAGLVHRDVKPANVLIASGKGVDRDDHAYLTDFGLTKHRGSQTGLTRAGGFIGTLEYIAPEQIEGKTVDGRADQYALAAIAVACLTGGPPFPRDSDVAIINAHLHDPPPSVYLRSAELPIAVDAVIARGLAKKPDDRYPDCKAFADDLRAALGVTATQTRPSAATTRDRRLPLVVGLLVVVALVAVVGFGLASGGRTGPSASPSADLAATSPSASVAAPPTEDVFPNAAEAELLQPLPAGLATSCGRGPYDTVPYSQFSSLPAPTASLSCDLSSTSGTTTMTIRRFPVALGQLEPGTNLLNLLRYFVGTRRIGSGDCSGANPSFGRWGVADADTGAVLCFVDGPTGDAIMYWTYDQPNILVKAVNQRGDLAALYDSFTKYARFIAP